MMTRKSVDRFYEKVRMKMENYHHQKRRKLHLELQGDVC